MSWESEIEENIISQGFHGGIILGQGGEILGKTYYDLKDGESTDIVTLFKNGKAYDSGIIVNGVKYICIYADETRMRGIRLDEGVCLVKTKNLILIGFYNNKNLSGTTASSYIDEYSERLFYLGY